MFDFHLEPRCVVVLEAHGLFRLDNFASIVADCLFDSLHILLHFSYTSTKLQNEQYNILEVTAWKN